MPFRENTAWVMMVMLTVTGAYYAMTVYTLSLALGQTAPPNIGLNAFVTGLLVVGAVVANIIAAAISPQDANTPEDERDKLVWWRAGNVSGWVLGLGAFAGLWGYFFLADGDMLFHIIVLSLVIAQIAEYALAILFYRRSWVV